MNAREAEGVGLIGTASMLEAMLDEVLAGAGLGQALEDESTLRRFCDTDAALAQAGDLDGAAAWLRGASTERIRAVIQLLTLRFHLRNKAEQIEIARINRERERSATPESPRAESVAEAVATLAGRGASLESLLETVGRLDIQPTLTAHPTEARRRAVLRKQGRVADAIDRLQDPRLLEGERAQEREGLRRVLLEMAMTDDVRSERLDAMDEVKNGLHYLSGSIWQMVPRLYEDLRRAIAEHYAPARGSAELPVLLRYRSWIGGDRDGNPRVTPDVTRQALRQHRLAAVDLYAASLEDLRQSLTISTHRRPASPALLEAIGRDASLDEASLRHLGFEPYRVHVLQMRARLRMCADDPAAYTPGAFEADVRLMQRSLADAGLESLAMGGPLADLLLRVRTFGLNLAALDIRQHSDVHEAAVDELLRAAGVCASYTELDEAARLAILRRELESPRPLLPRGRVCSETTAMVLDTLGVVREALDAEAHAGLGQSGGAGGAAGEGASGSGGGAIGSYVVSMTHQVSDILETLLLAKEAGLYRPATPGDPGISRLDVAPLFETIDDLGRAAGLLRELLQEPAYRGHLERRGMMQEVMLGYSDSNKDGGYWVANWLLQRAQDEVSRACADHGVQVRLFHGRGGTIGRGGGRANRAILAAPRASRSGRIRFTEQGEVISFRYALPAIAHRHLEQILSAMLLATHEAREPAREAETPRGAAETMEAIARSSMRTYRGLIEDPAFWGWYTSITPIAHISRLPIASRPVMRSPGTADFGRLRAIPWGFAWTQIRATVPGWYGMGAGLEEAIERDPGSLERFCAWNREWPIFGAIVANAEQELARARLTIAARYAASGDPSADGERLLALVRGEHDRTTRLVLQITGARSLLDRRPVIRDLIRARNPDTDALNLCQIELLQRWRALSARGAEDPALQATLLASINAIAAAMQSTG